MMNEKSQEILGCLLQILACPLFVFSAYAGIALGHIVLGLFGFIATIVMLSVGDHLGAPLLRRLGIITSWKR